MLCPADELVLWKDFPKGLQVLLLDQDESTAAETKLKLEAVDYNVHLYCNVNEALEATSKKTENFHIAIVEITSADSHESFRFFEMAKEFPVLAISNDHCLSTTMKCIAHGAAEFLQKPLSAEKLSNIWQHVVHKAFNAGGTSVSKSLQPMKEKAASMLQLHSVNAEKNIKSDKNDSSVQIEASTQQSVTTNSHDSKSVDITTDNLPNLINSSKEVLISSQTEDDITSGKILKIDECVSSKEKEPSVADKKKRNSFQCSNKCSKRKQKVDWTHDLHRKFIHAVEQLGVDQAIPSKILELMKVEGLTRHNIASHLQKYRMNRKQILPKNNIPNNYMQKQASMAVVPPPNHIYPHWNHQYYPNFSARTCFPAWYHYQNNWQWKNHPYQNNWQWKNPKGTHADAWGCPVISHYNHLPIYSQNTVTSNVFESMQERNRRLEESYDFHLADDVIDEVVKEAITKPWLPLPLGLKPPSIDGVLSELQRQGISKIPPSSNCHC